MKWPTGREDDAGDNRTRTREGKIVGDGDQRLRALGETEQGK